MDFELSDEQEALRDAAAALLDGRSSLAAVRAVTGPAEREPDGWDRALWAAMAEQGWPALAAPESLGGVGLGIVELAVLAEQVGAHVAPAPFTPHALAVDALATAAAGDDGEGQQRDGVLAALLAGELVGTGAYRAVDADNVGGVWRLHGRPEPLAFGPSAAHAIVRGVHGDGEESLFIVGIDDAAVAREPAMDRTTELGWLELDDQPAERLGGAEAVRRHLDLGAVLHSAELLGASSAALAMSVAYASEREQFGKPIGSFQAVKHRCADMLVDVEGMRSTVYYAAWALGAGDADASVAASSAKSWCSDAATRVLASALQVHGGIGFTWEHDLHLYLKRTQRCALAFGDAVAHRDRLAGLLRARIAAGDSIL